MEGAARGQGAQERYEEGLPERRAAGGGEGFKEGERALWVCVGGGEQGAEGERREDGVGGGVPLEKEEGGGRGQRQREEAPKTVWGERVGGERASEAREFEWREQLRPRRRGGCPELGRGFPHTGCGETHPLAHYFSLTRPSR